MPAFLLSAAPAVATQPAIPRTADGLPDLQGIWSNATATPLERPPEWGDRAVMTAEEAGALEWQARMRIENANQQGDPDRGPPTDGNANAGYNNFWVDRGTTVANVRGEYRTSLIIDPPDGQIPYLPEYLTRSRIAQWRALPGVQPFDGPEVRPLGERCLLAFGSSSGPPMLPVMYNNNYQIVQTQDHVMVLVEMVHDARIIPLNRVHNEAGTFQWMGRSVGSWEDDVLVVETRHFHPQQSFRGSGAGLLITERFELLTTNTLIYSATIDDPEVFDAPWRIEIPMWRRPPEDRIFEYACHEGNYAFPGILAGARILEHQ